MGAGVSGLVCAHLLHERHEVTEFFEAAGYAGGHTNTVEVERSGRRPMRSTRAHRVQNERTYPNFVMLLAVLGVESQPTAMSFSVHCEGDRPRVTNWDSRRRAHCWRDPRTSYARPSTAWCATCSASNARPLV